MIREFASAQGFPWGPAIALLLFIAVFIGVLVWIYRPGSREQYDRDARMPLEDDPRDRRGGADHHQAAPGQH